jgi:hypothetical protein
MTAIPPLLLLCEGRRPRPRKAPVARPKESLLQCAVADLLRRRARPDWRWSHFPAGEWRGVVTGAKLKRFGLMRGFPDLQLISPAGLFYGLELKRVGESLTDDQEAFQLWAIRNGIHYSVAFNSEQAFAVLTAWNCLRPIPSLSNQMRPIPAA